MTDAGASTGTVPGSLPRIESEPFAMIRHALHRLVDLSCDAAATAATLTRAASGSVARAWAESGRVPDWDELGFAARTAS